MYVFGLRGWGGDELMRRFCLDFTNPVGIVGVLDVCLCFGCGGVGGVGWDWVGVWMGGVVLCLCELRVCIICVDGRSRYLCIVFGGYLYFAPLRSLFGLLSLSEIIELHTLYAGCLEHMHAKIHQNLITNSEGIPTLK